MTDRTYLSIGDVLTLLREEFADVTISKIRFLESQGLVDPERTPSGYRKFYDDDVERLRWILRQQREHFLPLKVIKDRLDDDAGEAGETATPPTAAPPAGAAPAVAEAQSDAALSGGQNSEPLVAQPSEPVTPSTQAAPPAPTRQLQPSPPTRQPGQGPDGRGRTTAPVGRGPTQAPPPRSADDDPAVVPATRGPVAEPPLPTAPVAEPTTRAGSVTTGAPSPSPASSSPGVGTSGSSAPSSGLTSSLLSGGLTGVDLNLEELAAAAGLSVEDVGQLEQYGLLSGKPMGGTVYYDEEALTVARLVAGFRAFGIEARHLRMYKLAADREAGFFQQIILPLLKQRNPQARYRAIQMLDEMSRLGQALRASLLRIALRDQA